MSNKSKIHFFYKKYLKYKQKYLNFISKYANKETLKIYQWYYYILLKEHINKETQKHRNTWNIYTENTETIVLRD